MTEWTASLALVISMLVLIVQYRNQVERRHGEITQHRAGFLVRLSAIQQRMTSLKLHLETARLEGRKMPESDEKYELIEQMPVLLSGITECTKEVERLREGIEGIDTQKSNRSATLMAFQSAEHGLLTTEEVVSNAEEQALSPTRGDSYCPGVPRRRELRTTLSG